MKIAMLTAGTGSLTCRSCLWDTTLANALVGLGHEVILVPLYLPLALGLPHKAREAPLFLNGIRLYLQVHAARLARLPAWLTRVLDSPSLLRAVGRRAEMTSPANLGDMTLSMLEGARGPHRLEVEALVKWLSREAPEVLCLPNALLIGLAEPLRDALRAPIVCSFQGEDEFLDALAEPWRERAWRSVAGCASQVDVFVGVSESHARTMQRRLGLEDRQVTSVSDTTAPELASEQGSRSIAPLQADRVMGARFANLCERARERYLRLAGEEAQP